MEQHLGSLFTFKLLEKNSQLSASSGLFHCLPGWAICYLRFHCVYQSLDTILRLYSISFALFFRIWGPVLHCTFLLSESLLRNLFLIKGRALNTFPLRIVTTTNIKSLLNETQILYSFFFILVGEVLIIPYSILGLFSKLGFFELWIVIKVHFLTA